MHGTLQATSSCLIGLCLCVPGDPEDEDEAGVTMATEAGGEAGSASLESDCGKEEFPRVTRHHPNFSLLCLLNYHEFILFLVAKATKELSRDLAHCEVFVPPTVVANTHPVRFIPSHPN